MTKTKLHIFIQRAGVASRRKSSELILSGKVHVNGSPVKNVAYLVDQQKDTVSVLGKKIEHQEECVYYAFNKPAGVVSTTTDPDHRKTVLSFFPKTHRLYPVGRLDMESTGLMLVTNDGDLSYVMTHPKFEVEKTYRVLLASSPSNTQLNKLAQGVKLKDGWTKPATVKIVSHEGKHTWIDVSIHEGRNRQVRRMCAYVGLEILKLTRVQMGPLQLQDLGEGKYRSLTPKEIASLRALIS